MAPRDLGEEGESTLRSWAANRGITAQKVQIDRTGWDFQLEFDFEPKMGPGGAPLAMDRCLAPLSCLVQVKATTAARASRPVPLKNCLRLAKSLLPAFFLLLRFGRSSVPKTAYLVPIDEEWVRRILERTRQADSQGQGMRGLTLTLTPAESHRIGADGESLEPAIRAHIGPSMEDYAARKAAWNRDVGFEKGTGTLSFHVPQESLQGVSLTEYLVDLAVGTRESLAIRNARIEDVRFGIPASRPLVELPEAVLDLMPQPVGKVEIRLKCGTASASRIMDLYCPDGLAAAVEPGDLKYRLTSKFMSIVVTSSGLSFHLTLPELDAKESLRELYELASVVLLIEDGAGSRERMECTLTREDKVLFRARLENSPRFAPQLVKLAVVIRDAWKIAKHLDINDKVEISLADLLAQNELLTTFLALIEPKRAIVRFSSAQSIGARGRQVCLPIGVRVSLGRFRATAVGSFWGPLKWTELGTGDEIEYELANPQLRLDRSFATCDGEATPTIAEMVHAVADACDDSVDCVILSQFAMG